MHRILNFISWPFQRLAARALRAKFVWITPQLVQGPSFPSRNGPSVMAMGIDSVLDLREPDGHDAATLAEANLQYFHHPMPEYDPPTLAQLEEGVRWSLAEIAAGRTVLVHCRVGKSRSACMACAILIGEGHRLSSAMNTVREARPDMLLTEAQLVQLEELEVRVRTEGADLGGGRLSSTPMGDA